MGIGRSENMARIRGRDTKPESLLRRALWARGLRYRKHLPIQISGKKRKQTVKPDLVFPARQVAVFVDGCFWHGCPDHYVRPRTRHEFWAAKLVENVERDQRQTAQVTSLGWTVLRVWEHELMEGLDKVVDRVLAVLDGALDGGEHWRVTRVTQVAGDDNREERLLVSLAPPTRTMVTSRPRWTGKLGRPPGDTRST